MYVYILTRIPTYSSLPNVLHPVNCLETTKLMNLDIPITPYFVMINGLLLHYLIFYENLIVISSLCLSLSLFHFFLFFLLGEVF